VLKVDWCDGEYVVTVLYSEGLSALKKYGRRLETTAPEWLAASCEQRGLETSPFSAISTVPDEGICLSIGKWGKLIVDAAVVD